MVIYYNRSRLKTVVIFAFKISNKTERSAKVFRATTKRELVDLKTFWKGNSLTWRRCPTPRRRCRRRRRRRRRRRCCCHCRRAFQQRCFGWEFADVASQQRS